MWSNARTQAVSASLFALFAVLTVSAAAAHAQSIATLKGRIRDASGAVVRGAMITVRDQDTGVQQSGTSDAAGEYHFAFLAVGAYRIEVRAPGFRSEVLPNLVIEVGRTIVWDFQLRIGAATETVEVASDVPVIERSMTLGQVVDRRTVEAIPLNGRQLLQLALLVPGSVTPPQNGFLTAPSRAQGSQGINTAGHREDTANFQVNGVTLNDQVNNILVFQPPLDSVQEFRIDNSSPAADQGRSSGASIDIVTRSGANPWHGGVSEFFRNERLDARNLFSPDPAPFDRHQFGAQLGGPIVRNRTFFLATYEGIRQQQGLPVNSVVLSDGQRAAITHPVIAELLALVPRATMTDERGTARFVGWADAHVDVDRLAGDVTHQFDSADRLHGFYAFQRDWRQEPLELGNTLPGFGDVRQGQRQLLTLEHTRTIGSRVVNQARVGFNRIAFEARAGASALPDDYHLETRASAPGLPVFNVAGAFNFGGPANIPQGRTDTTVLVSDTVSYAAGRHAIKVGGEYRRSTITSWMLDAGTFNFPTVAAFAAGTANAFSVVIGDRAADISQRALGGFVQDSFRAHPTLTFDAGLRYEWNVTPTERDDRFIVFDAPTVSLEPVGVHRATVYEQNNHNIEPRVGIAWDPSRDGRTLIRAAYAFTVEQPMVNAVLNLTANPPLNTPLTVTGTVPVASAFALAAAGGLAPITVDPRYDNGVTHGWNVNLQREVARGLAVMAGYVAARGSQLRLTRNLNQPLDGIRPYRALSTLSPILPGTPLGNITQVESSGTSRYQALWASFSRRLSRGLQFGASYTWSKSFDSNSLSSPPTTVTVQNGYDIEDSWGPSDFDATHRFVLHAFYELPFGSGPVLRGWQIAAILQAQSGNPLNIVTSNSSLTGVANTVRPDVTGPITIVGSVDRWFDTSVFVPVNGFGNLGRNAVVGPRFDALDMSVSKTIPVTSTLRAQLRVEVFNVLNHPNLGQPGRIVGSPNFGVITNTRFPPGDSGSSRQVQVGLKIQF
jgi:hypothetical protein